MAMTQWQILNSDGSPGGTQVCEGDTCYPQLLAGQSRVQLTDTPQDATAPKVTRINADGTLAQPIEPAAPAPVQSSVVSRQASVPIDAGLPATFTPAPSGSSFGDPLAAAPTQYATPPASFGSAPPPSGMLPSMQNIPPYQNGQLHPAAGGQPLVPGGVFNQNQGQYDNRQQVYVPGGAAAGPYQTRAAEAPRGGNANYGGSGGGGGGGGGSLAKSMYWRIRNQVESKIGQMGPGGSSGSYKSYGSSGSNQYARQQKKISKAYDKYNKALANPPPQKAHGWAKQNLGKNKGDYPLLLNDPMRVATEGLGLSSTNQGQAGTYDFLSSLPVADLAMITGGTRGRGLTMKTPVVKPPHILEQQKGFKPVKPQFKRTLDYSDYAEQLAKMYLGLNSENSNLLDMRHLMGDLAHASRRGALRQGITQQAKYDQSGALDRARGYFDSIFAATQNADQAQVYADMADRFFHDQNLLNKKPKQISKIVPRVARMFR